MSAEMIEFLNVWDEENQYWEDLCHQHDLDMEFIEGYL